MKRIEDLWREAGVASPLSLQGCPVKLGQKNRVHILALGDVGTTMLMGLRLLGGDAISTIGILDLSRENMLRLEQEINQISWPFGQKALPEVCPISGEELFDCDVFVFCASKGSTGAGRFGRRAHGAAFRQYTTDPPLRYAGCRSGFKGLAAVVSDPVDPLCRAFLDSSQLAAWQVQGYGLGVMNARALYYSKRDPRFARYAEEGRAFGPHGADLVIADSIRDYDDVLSRELTELTVSANMRVRELGYKPYIAPALSSAAISILLTLQGGMALQLVVSGRRRNRRFSGDEEPHDGNRTAVRGYFAV